MSYSPAAGDLGELVRRQVAAGFDDRATIAARVAHALALADDDPEVAAALDAAVAAHARAAARWPAETDCTRLDRAFAALAEDGIVARQHFACCATCAHDEIRDEIHDAREAGQRVTGYAFYHWQDTDLAVAGDGLRVRYAGLDGNAAAVGQAIARALAAAALPVEWNGDPHRTIRVPTLDWKRRAPPAPVAPVAAPPLARWCEAVPRAAAADLAGALGPRYGAALVRLGAPDRALAWARVSAARGPALAGVAMQLPADARAPLLVEAIEAAAWGRRGELVDVLVAGELADPAVRDAARARVREVRDDEFGAAAAAWFAVRAGGHEDVAGFVEFAREVWASDAHDARVNADAAAALGAALWALADAAAADAMAAEVQAKLTREDERYAHRAFVAAAAHRDQLELAEAWAHAQLPALRGAVIEALVGAGHPDEAAASAARGFDHAACFARLANAAPADPRAADWRDHAAQAATHAAADVAAGLVTAAAVQLAAIERAPDLAALAVIAAAERARVLAAGAALRAQLAAIAAGGAVPPATAPDLDRALAAAQTRAALVAIAPAVLARAADPRAAAAAMLAAWDQAEPR